jgi:hypothetical protein
MKPDEKYLRWVRAQACCVCGFPGPSHAHHHLSAPSYSPGQRPEKSAGTKRGKSQKASDFYTIALCIKDHSNLHLLKGFFSGYTGNELREWQDNQVAAHHERFDADELARGVAPTPIAGAPVPSRLDGFDVEAAAAGFLATYGGETGPQVHHDLVRLLEAAMRAARGKAA